jgi:hypothetical protein
MSKPTYPSTNYPQRIIQGDTWVFSYQVKLLNAGTGETTPVDISSWTFAGEIKQTREAAESTPVTVTVVDAAQGKLRFSVSETVTEDFPLGTLYYAITYSNAEYGRKTMFRGPFQVE